jgi:pyruvate,water dikinase
MLFGVGRRLVAADAIEEPDDVFWLEGDELIGAALDAGQTELESLSGVARERKSAWRARWLATAALSEGGKVSGDGLAALDAGAGGATNRRRHRGCRR